MSKYLLEEVLLSGGSGDKVVECRDGAIRCHSVILVRNPNIFQRFNMLCKCMKTIPSEMDSQSSTERKLVSVVQVPDAVSLKNVNHVCRFEVPFATDVVLVIVRYLYLGGVSLPHSMDQDFMYRLLVASDYLSVHQVFETTISLLNENVSSGDDFYSFLGLYIADTLIQQTSVNKLLDMLTLLFIPLSDVVIRHEQFPLIPFFILSRFLKAWLKETKCTMSQLEIESRWNTYGDKPLHQLEMLKTLIGDIEHVETIACGERFHIAHMSHVLLRFHAVNTHLEIQLDNQFLFSVSPTIHMGIFKATFCDHSHVFLTGQTIDIGVKFKSSCPVLSHGQTTIFTSPVPLVDGIVTLHSTKIGATVQLVNLTI